MINLHTFLIVLAFFLFALAAIGLSIGRFNPIGAGLALLVLAYLIS